MRREYEGRAVGFLALTLEPDVAKVRRAAEQLGIQMPVAIAHGEILAPAGVDAVPSTLFVSADGRIVMAAKGPRGAAFFRKRVRELAPLTLSGGGAPAPP